MPLSTALPASTTTPLRILDKIAPATDPKWYFPPLPEQSRKPEVARSSSVTAYANSPTSRCRTIQQEPTPSVQAKVDLQQTTIPVAAVVGPEGQTSDDGSKRVLRRFNPKVEIKSQRRHRSSNYIFTEEDDIQIAKLKVLHGRSWAEIRDSEQKWMTWPLQTFQQRWHKRLKGRNLHLQECTASRDTRNGPGYSRQETVTLPAHQLPTPSVSEQEDGQASVFDASTGTIENIMSSSTHFDDDERDLLSLAGEEIDDAQSAFDNVENETFFPGADEMVLPSVELTGFIDDDTLQQGPLEGSPTGDAAATPVRIKKEPPYSSPSKKQKPTQKPISYQAMPDSYTEAEGNDTGSAPPRRQEQSSFLCDICKATFQNVANLDQHRTNVHTSPRQLRPKSASLDLIGDDDELQTSTPTTAHIKGEFSTPPPTGFLVSTPLGQMRSYADLPPSGVQSASGLSRRAYLKQVKQSWAKRSSPAPKTIPKRKTFHTIPRKRAWAGDAESEDELGL
ncbi:hypothetical protein BDU57DRAFT_458357 [Ampelomyces quisqualis]|uniref:C2H2-type domain-containing protein n=1 Tax=Ampelomyces quisqualis TaxID=50730 RepID=A0A6A5QD31_AMPQU|nr:hypothetical protein BDU57DRAFT_458357 [Ampelomyces quisqualis]